MYKEIECKKALNKIKRAFPYSYDLNIYRGCKHRCKYCFAMYSHKFIESSDFFNDIFIKKNIVESLEKELANKNWKKDVINIGGVTDSYQPIERDRRIMPEILKLLIKYKNPAIICTKSDLILRDFDLINELSNITYVNISSTITTVNETLRKKIEPGAVSSRRRFEMLKEFKRTNASIGMHVMPIIPYITDNYENLDLLFRNAKIAEVDFVLVSSLNLIGETKKSFLEFIKLEYSELYYKMELLYKDKNLKNKYNIEIFKIIRALLKKYELTTNYNKILNEKLKKDTKFKQLSFFEND